MIFLIFDEFAKEVQIIEIDGVLKRFPANMDNSNKIQGGRTNEVHRTGYT